MKAFPSNINGTFHNDGMDLRDYFAAKAMQSIILEDLTALQEKYDMKRSEMISQLAYKYADAMMKAREA